MIGDLARELAKEISTKSRDVYEIIMPPADIYQDGAELVVKVDLAGFRKEDIKVSITESYLTISAERDEEKGVTYFWQQRPLRVYRRILLPVKVKVPEEGIAAKYEDGVLTVRLPVKELTQIKVE